jgi:hypothetical protein
MIELCEHAGVYSFLQDEKNHIIKKQTKRGCCAHKTSLAKPLLLKLLFQAGEVSCHVFVGMGIHFPFCNNFSIGLWSRLTVWYFPFFILFIYSSNFDWFGLWCLTPFSTIFQLYRGGQFY